MENARPLPERFRRRNPRPLEQSIPNNMSVSWSKVGKRLSTRGFNDPVSEKDNIIFIFCKTVLLKYTMGKWRIIKRKRNEDLIVHQLVANPYWNVNNGKIRIGVLVTAKRYVMLYLQEEDIPKEYMSGKYDEISIKTLHNKFKALADEVNAAAVPVEEMNVLHLKL